MSELHVESTTSTAPAPSSSPPSTPASPSEAPSRPAWPFALLAWGLIVALIAFEMAC
jgi:hypothetical protein